MELIFPNRLRGYEIENFKQELFGLVCKFHKFDLVYLVRFDPLFHSIAQFTNCYLSHHHQIALILDQLVLDILTLFIPDFLIHIPQVSIIVHYPNSN